MLLLRRAVGTVFGVGPGYEPQPPDGRFNPDVVEAYYLDYSSKTLATTPSAGLVPADLAQLALGWWSRHLAGESSADSSFLEICRELERRATREEGKAWWPYAVAVPKYGLRPPWHSAMAQGQIASVFTRAFGLTRDTRYAALARAAVHTLLPPSPLVSTTPSGPILEEAPSTPASHILNGWIFALWGVRDVSLALDEAAARRLYRSSLSALREMLPRYDVGWWSRYSLFPHALRDLAKPFYHRLHVDQLQIIGRAENLPEFTERAERWRRYDNAPHRAAAIAQKVAFSAIDGVQRRRR